MASTKVPEKSRCSQKSYFHSLSEMLGNHLKGTKPLVNAKWKQSITLWYSLLMFIPPRRLSYVFEYPKYTKQQKKLSPS